MTKVALVTGAAGGMGSATAALFRSRGYEVVGVDRVPAPVDSGIYFQGDICDEAMWSEIAKTITDRFGQLDALVNIAGRNYLAVVEEADLGQWRNMFEVNVIGMIAAIKHVKHLMLRADAPAMVNMSSIAGYIGSVGYAAYCASKGAVDSLTRSLALELAPKIRVNAVAPGWIETPFTVEGLEKSADPVAYRREVEAMHALGRVGTPDEIARVIYFLASAESSFMTGSVVVSDGGYMIKN